MFKVFAISGCVGVFVVVVMLILGQLINIGPLRLEHVGHALPALGTIAGLLNQRLWETLVVAAFEFGLMLGPSKSFRKAKGQ